MRRNILNWLFSTSICLLSTVHGFSQAPLINWQNTIGGGAADELYSIISNLDDGYILAGHSFSDISGDKSENHIGSSDFWIMKVDHSGSIIWQKTIGGTNSDFLKSAKLTPDNGYIFAGYSRSDSSGNKSENVIGGDLLIYDYWIVKTDSLGNIEWENTIGGSGNDYLYSVDLSADGGYYLGGYSDSNISDDKAENSYGGYDYWVIKIDSLGNIIWEKTLGGSADEYFYSIVGTTEGGCFLGGYSSSGISGSKTELSRGYNDYWVIKLDELGNIVWQKTIGGNLFEYLKCVQQTIDGGYIIGGYSTSGATGDKTESNHGSDDYWILKLDSLGNITWQNAMNGNNSDKLQSIEQTLDGGYIVGGYSKSGGLADKSENSRGGYDYWVLKLSPTGSVQWDKTLGGTLDDELFCVTQAPDGDYLFGGFSFSGNNGDKTEISKGVQDFWLINMAYCIQEVCNSIDDDCDGLIDDADPDVFGQPVWYADIDLDTYGSEVNDSISCYLPVGYLSDNSDCNDFDSDVNLLAMEIINGIDDNCDGIIDVIDNLFIKGQFLEVGINSCGAYASTDSPPLGFHPNAEIGGNLKLGMVADRDKDGWDAGSPLYCGDYAMPGEAIEGWAIELDGNVWYNAEYNCEGNDIPGSNIYFEKTDDLTTTVWEGMILENGLEINQRTELVDTNLFFITYITLKNTGLAELSNLYYLRTIDPDPEEVLTGNFSTFNQVLSNPPIDTDALVVGEGLAYGCFLGLGAMNPDARASYGGFGIIDHIPSEIWSGTGVYEISGSDTSDTNNSIVFNIPFIGVGDSVKFAFAYIFSPEFVEEALAATNISCVPTPELCNTLDDNCNGLIDDGITESISISAGGATTFCKGGNVLLSATYTGATVQWRKNEIDIPGATAANYTATKTGTYTCVTTSPCGVATSTGILVTVYPNPPASITAGGATTFCMGGSVVLTANAGGGLSYQWYKGASAIVGATSINYTATTAGNYRCRVTKTATGCYKNSNIITVSVPCRQEDPTPPWGAGGLEIPSFTIYPNPATDKLTITVNSSNSLNLLNPSHILSITDITGKAIATFELVSSTTDIDISQLSAGIYFIQISRNGSVFTQKFVKAE